MRYVFDFAEGSGGGRELLGGKGIGLAEMTALGVPVPDGFTITTEACRAYLAGGGEVPAGLDDEVDEHIAALEERTGKGFGDDARPAARLRPLRRRGLDAGDDGHDPQPRPERRRGRGSRRVDRKRALRARLVPRLIQMYGEVVDEVDGQRFEQALTDLKAARGVTQDVELTADDLRELVATFASIYEEETGRPFPQEPRDQLRRAYRAVFDSWNAPRAQVYRRRERHPGRPRHRGQRRADGLREPRRGVRHGRVLHARPGDGRAAALRRVPLERAGRGRRRGHPHARAHRAHARADAGGVRPARRHARPARGALPRPAGHRVHGRGGDALPPADAHGQADGRGGAARRRRRWSTRGSSRARRRSRASIRPSSTSSCTR